MTAFDPIEQMKQVLKGAGSAELFEKLESGAVAIEKRSSSTLSPELAHVVGEILSFLSKLDESESR